MKKHILFLLMISLSCTHNKGSQEMKTENGAKQITKNEIQNISSKKIYFGHMSVGYNIMDGLKETLTANATLNIKETFKPEDFTLPVFAHSSNGENTRPETKISAFVNKIESGLGEKVDIAFFKFCYVDITAGTDVNLLFKKYKEAMDILIKKYPKTTFLHVTVPVTNEDITVTKAVKNIIKFILGRNASQSKDNIKRMEFSNLLRKEYGKYVFDLAKIESSGDISIENKKEKNGFQYYSMLNTLTDDGGHLNKTGSASAAYYLVQFINNLK